jgi:hypothetical protein
MPAGLMPPGQVPAGNGGQVVHVQLPPPGYPQPIPGQLHPAQLPHRPAPAQLPPGQRPASMTLLYIWILLFGFVGTQLGWTLRPFFGDPGQHFQLFRNLDGTFYGDIISTIGHLLGH